MTLREALELASLRRSVVVAGASRLDNDVMWVHVVDNPDPLPWVRERQLVLTTGYAWPRDGDAQRDLLRHLFERRVSAVGLAVPQFFEHIPACMVREADELGLPLLEIPWEIPFAEITQEVHTELLAERTRMLERSETIHRALTTVAGSARSLSEIAGALAGLVHRVVAFIALDGDVLAAASPEGESPCLGAGTENATPSPTARAIARRFAERTRHSDPNRVEAHLLEYPPDAVGGRCVAAPVRVQTGVTALAVLLEGNRELERLDGRAAEHAAIVAALHLAHQSELASMELRLRRSFLDSLVEGQFEVTPQALERARMLGFEPDGAYRATIALLLEPVPLSVDGFARREDVAERARKRLLDLGAAGLVTASLNRVAMLLPAKWPPERIWDALPHDRLALLAAEPAEGVDGVRAAFADLLAAVPYVREAGLVPRDSLLLPRVLQGDADAQHAFLAKFTGRLGRCRGGERLVETLLALPAEAYNLRRTSDRLGIHISTLRHRLERIEDELGVDLQDPRTRVEVGLVALLSPKT